MSQGEEKPLPNNSKPSQCCYERGTNVSLVKFRNVNVDRFRNVTEGLTFSVAQLTGDVVQDLIVRAPIPDFDEPDQKWTLVFSHVNFVTITGCQLKKLADLLQKKQLAAVWPSPSESDHVLDEPRIKEIAFDLIEPTSSEAGTGGGGAPTVEPLPTPRPPSKPGKVKSRRQT